MVHYYRKFLEKSRSFCSTYLNITRTDIFLITAVIFVFLYIVVNRACETVNEPARINIGISSQCVLIFGRDTADALIAEFEEQYPNLRIQEIAQDTAADIVFFDDSEFGRLAQDGPFISLVSFMDIFVYNIDILKEANLDRPPKTRAEFLTAARAVAGNNTASALALGLSPEDPLALRRDFYPWIWASGADIGSIDLSGDNPALPRAVTDTIAFLGQMNRDKMLAPGTFEKTGQQRRQEFAEGKIAMMTISAREIAFLLNSAHGITFGITALPLTTQGKNRLGLSNIYAGISSGSLIPDEAALFLSFLESKSDVLAEALGAVPGSYPGSFDREYIEKNELYAKAWDIFQAAEIVEYKPGQPSEEKFNRLIREKLTEALNADN